MTPTHDQRVLLGDCRDVLPTLRRRDFAVVLVDPPYGIRNASHRGPRPEHHGIAGDEDTAVRDAVLAWAEGIPVACFASWRFPPPNARGRVVWDKGPCAGMGDLAFPWRASAEDLFLFGPWCAERRHGVIRCDTPPACSVPRQHPHEKPVALLREILQCAPPGLVLDPCCGSGSTLIAARELGRPALGIEVDPKWHAVAVERLRQGLLVPAVTT